MDSKVISYCAKYEKELMKLIHKLIVFESAIEKDRIASSEVSKKYFDELTSNKSAYIFLLIIDSKISGYISLILREQEEPYTSIKKFVEIRDLYIDEKYRHQGFGTILIKYAEEFCKDNKVSHLFITSLYDNYNAQIAYRKMGFRKYELKMLKEV